MAVTLLRSAICQARQPSLCSAAGRWLYTAAARQAPEEPQRLKLLGLPIPSWMLKSHIEATPDFNRWLIPPVAIGLHLCIGSVYAWSVFNDPLTRALGVVGASSADWTLGQVVPTFGVAIATLGISAAVGSRFIEMAGPRCTGLVAAGCWGTGHLLASAGVWTHCLPLVIGGYGLAGGVGLGLGYVTPVSTLLRWFPDRKGMAAGMAVAGFGGGAISGVALNKFLLAHFKQPPTLLCSQDDAALQTIEGIRYATVDGVLREVVVATLSDVSSSGLDAGAYLVGSGSTGVAETFACLGVGYAAVIATCAVCFRVPAANWSPRGWTPNSPATKQIQVRSRSVSMDAGIKTPQFWFLWTALGCNIAAGIGIIGCATTIMDEVFASALPHIVTPGFCAGYVAIIAASNILGRLVWASFSDYTGRQRMVSIYLGLGIPLYMSMPAACMMVGDAQTLPLIIFTGSSMVLFSFYGGMFATVPAYLGDLFGPKHVGGIHGRLLTAWSLAGIAGPQTMATLRERASGKACRELTEAIEPAVFESTFGAPASDLEVLLATKTVTLKRLVELMPPGMQDPTPFLYNESLYTSASLLVIGFSANHMIRRVDRNRFDLNPDGNQEDYSFVAADSKHDGVVDRDEAKHFGISDEDFDTMDTRCDGVICLSEWRDAENKGEVRLI